MQDFTLVNNKLLLCGKTKSGKSQILRYLLIRERKKFDKVFLFCPTERINNFYDGLIKKENIYENFSEQWLEMLLKKLSDMYSDNKDKNKKMKNILLIFDDCCSDTNFHQSDAIVKLFTRGRHLNISICITSQYPYHIPPICRVNCDYILVGQLNKQSIQLLKDEFLVGNIDSKEFTKMYYRTTGDYQFLIINNNSVKNNDNLDEIYGTIKCPTKYLK
jgi:hypothetical protein